MIGTSGPTAFRQSCITLALLLLASASCQSMENERVSQQPSANSQRLTRQANLRWDPLNEPGPGGWVTALDISPFDSNVILFGADMFGASVSDDGGASWQTGSGFQSWGTYSFTRHPTNPRIIWAGSMGGPYRSMDGGFTWVSKRRGMPAPGPSSHSAQVQLVCFDPNDSNTLLAFGGNHRNRSWTGRPGFGVVWKSTNGGDDWTRLAIIDDPAIGTADDAIGVSIVDAGFAASSSSVLYACSTEGGVYKSSNRGVWWIKINQGLPNTRVNWIALHPTNPNILWATLNDGGGIYKSTDGGNSWFSSNAGMDEIHGRQGAGKIAVCKTNPDILYAYGETATLRCVYKSTNGGSSWTKVTPTDNTGIGQIIGGHAYNAILAVQQLTVDPNNANHILLGTSEVILRSTDGGATWRDIGAYRVGDKWRGNGCSTIAAWNLAFNPYKPLQVFTAGGDMAKMLQTDDGGWSWKLRADGIRLYNGSYSTAFARNGTIYLGTGRLFRNHINEPIAKSTDWGATWAYLPRPEGASGDNGSVYTLPDDADKVWAAVNNVLYRSSDGGQTWIRIEHQFGSRIYNIAGDPQTPTTFYVATSGGVHKTADGITFSVMPGSERQGRWYVKVDPINTNVLWAVYKGDDKSGLWTSDGKAWRQVWAKRQVCDVAIDPASNQRLAVTTIDGHQGDTSAADGVWISTNCGVTWIQCADGLKMPACGPVAFNIDKSGELYVGTEGTGYYAMDLGTSTPFASRAHSTVGPIEAENFDVGGEGVAYHDSSVVDKAAGGYRKDAVGIRSGGSGRVVCDMAAGEWLKYRVNVPARGLYDIVFRVASANGGGRFHLTANGVNVTGPVAIKSTGDADRWDDVVVRNVRLRAGEQYLKLYVEHPGADLDSIRITSAMPTSEKGISGK